MEKLTKNSTDPSANESQTKTSQFWKDSWNRTENIRQSIKQNFDKENELKQSTSKKEIDIQRVNQLDSVRLDSELIELLSQQFFQSFSLFRSDLIAKFKPELILLVDCLLFRYSVWSTDSTYGLKLQNLKMVSARFEKKKHCSIFYYLIILCLCFFILCLFVFFFYSLLKPLTTKEKLLYGFLTIFPRWIWTRFQSYANDQNVETNPNNLIAIEDEDINDEV